MNLIKDGLDRSMSYYETAYNTLSPFLVESEINMGVGDFLFVFACVVFLVVMLAKFWDPVEDFAGPIFLPHLLLRRRNLLSGPQLRIRSTERTSLGSLLTLIRSRTRWDSRLGTRMYCLRVMRVPDRLVSWRS